MQVPSNFTQSVLHEGATEEKGENARLVRAQRSHVCFMDLHCD